MVEEQKYEIYLDNGATTQVAPEVIAEMTEHFSSYYGNPSSLHSYGRDAKKELEDARASIAKKINADSDEIIFTSGGSESDNLAIKGYVYLHKHKGNHIIISKIEHPAVLNTAKSLEKEGFKVTYLDVDKKGFVDLEKLQKAITKKTLLVSIMHANNEIGTIQNIKKIGKICKSNNVIFHTDAVQSFTKVPIDVKDIDVDMISMSAHKIHGPKGIGALYIRRGVRIKKLIDGGSQEMNLRSGTENVPLIKGFSKAVSLVAESDKKRTMLLRDKLIEGLLSITKDCWLNGPEGEDRLYNNVNISYNYIEGESLLLYLDEEGIAASTGSACSSNTLEPSHVLMALGIKQEEAHGSLRFTLSKYTTEGDIDIVIEKMKHIVKKLRDMSPLVKK